MNTLGSAGSALYPGQRAILRLHDPEQPGLVTRRRGLLLAAGLMLAAAVYVTGGGGAFYDSAYGLVERAEARWARAQNGPLSFLNREKPAKDRFELQGIVYSSNRPIAVINQQPCAPGEKVAVRLGDESEIIGCLSIDPNLVQIQTLDGETASLSLVIAEAQTDPDAAAGDAPGL